MGLFIIFLIGGISLILVWQAWQNINNVKKLKSSKLRGFNTELETLRKRYNKEKLNKVIKTKETYQKNKL